MLNAEELIAKLDGIELSERFKTKIKNVVETINKREEAVASLEKTKKELEKTYRAKEKQLSKNNEDVLCEKQKDIQKLNATIDGLKQQEWTRHKKISDLDIQIAEKQKSIDLELSTYRSERLSKINNKISEKLMKDVKEARDASDAVIESVLNQLSTAAEKLPESYKRLTEEYNKLASANVEFVDSQKQKLASVLSDYEKKVAEMGDIVSRETVVSSRERIIEKRESRFGEIVDAQLQRKHAELIKENQSFENRIGALKNTISELNAENERLQKENEKLAEAGSVSTLNQLNEYRKKIQEYNEKYRVYSDFELSEERRKASLYDDLNQKCIDLSAENIVLQRKVLQLKGDKQTNDSLKFENDALKLSIRTNDAYLERLKNELEDLKKRIEGSDSNDVAKEAIELPLDQFKDLPIENALVLNETDWLDKIEEKSRESGYRFSKRLIYSFHTCLKTASMSPLTVLAGISGTGKSKLPQLYSRFGGIYFISLPVQPDWDSPQSLFGYYNTIEKRFNATTLLRAMVSFQKQPNDSESIYDLSDGVLLVLLDEMNLAHVELYFADLLSKLEEQRGQNDVQFFEVDLGAGNPRYRVRLSRNILWAGTMNEDETTKSLSDKVIDRGNVISFPRPSSFERYTEKNMNEPSRMIKRSVWESWCAKKLAMTDQVDSIINNYCNKVSEINEYLKYANKALGHRVWQSIENYMIAHPIVLKYEKNSDKLPIALKCAFEEAVVHKIMPKLRGIDLSEDVLEFCLKKIQGVFDELNLSARFKDDFEKAINNSSYQTFVWDSASYLDEDYDI